MAGRRQKDGENVTVFHRNTNEYYRKLGAGVIMANDKARTRRLTNSKLLGLQWRFLKQQSFDLPKRLGNKVARADESEKMFYKDEITPMESIITKNKEFPTKILDYLNSLESKDNLIPGTGAMDSSSSVFVNTTAPSDHAKTHLQEYFPLNKDNNLLPASDVYNHLAEISTQPVSIEANPLSVINECERPPSPIIIFKSDNRAKVASKKYADQLLKALLAEEDEVDGSNMVKSYLEGEKIMKRNGDGTRHSSSKKKVNKSLL